MAELSGYAIGGRITESVVGDGSVIASDIVVTYKLTQADGSDLAAGTRVEDPVEGAEVLKVGYGNVEGGVTSAEGTQSEDGESTLPTANVWVSDRLLKPNVAALAVDALVPQNLAWKFDVWANAREAKLGNKKGGTKAPLVTYLVQLDGDADYSSNLLTGVTGPGGVNVLDVLQLVDPTPSAPASDQFAAAMASRPDTINAAADATDANFAAAVRAVAPLVDNSRDTPPDLQIMTFFYDDGGYSADTFIGEGMIDGPAFHTNLSANEAAVIDATTTAFGYTAVPYELVKDVAEAPYPQTRDDNYRTTIKAFLAAGHDPQGVIQLAALEYDNNPSNLYWAENRFLEAGVATGSNNPTGLTSQEAYEQWFHFYLADNHDGNTDHHQLGRLLDGGIAGRGWPVACVSVWAGTAHWSHQMGFDIVFVECAIDTVSGIIGKIAFHRGAAMQYAGRWGVDLSYWRQASPAGAGVTAFDDGSLTTGWTTDYHRRHLFLAWATGAEFVLNEPVSFWNGAAEGEDYNPLALMFAEFGQFRAANPDRGTPVAPFAIVKDHNTFFEPRYYTSGFQQRNLFFQQITARPVDHLLHNLWAAIYPGANEHGTSTTAEEPMGASRYGESFDILTTEADASRWDPYRVLVWAAETLDADDIDAVADWVSAGGTLIVSASQLPSTAAQALTGVSVGPATSDAGGTVTWAGDSSTTTEVAYERFELGLGAADAAATNQAGAAVIAKRRLGDGAVYTVASEWMSNSDSDDANRAVLDVVVKMLDEVASETLPLLVDLGGDPIEWAIGELDDGYLLTLINTAQPDAAWSESVTFSGTYTVTELVTGTALGSRTGSFTASVPGGDCRVYRLEQP